MGNEPSLKFFEAQSGYLSAKLEYPDGSTHHLHSLVAPQDEWCYYGDLEIWGDVVVLLGTGLGYHLLSAMTKCPAQTRFILVDFHDEIIERCASALFEDRRAELIKISSSSFDFDSLAADHGRKRLQIIRHPASVSAYPAFYSKVLRALASRRARPRSKSRSVLLLYGNYFLEEELNRAAQLLGIDHSRFEYCNCRGPIDYESRLGRQIDSARPDLILSVNMKGFDGNGILAEQARARGIPLAVWFVDDPHPILLQQEQFADGSLNAFCWERQYVPWLSEHGFARAGYLPLATDPDLLASGGSNGPRCRLGFVGSSMGLAFLADIAAKFLWRDDLKEVVDAASKVLSQNPSRNVHEILRRVCFEKNIDVPFPDRRNMTWLCSYIIHSASMLRRREVVSSLVPLGVETFGDAQGWLELCGSSLVTHPDVDYRTQIGALYRRIGVNINITSCQMPTAVNQRVFDVPAAGGFLITDDQPDVHELFAENEVVTYATVEELREKIECYASESQRQAISQRARKRIMCEHTYQRRLKRIMDTVIDGNTL